MNTFARIQHFLRTWKRDKILPIRRLLEFGSRAAVDSAVFKLVESGLLRRVAQGLLVFASSKKNFSNAEVAQAKAEAFGREFMIHPEGSDANPSEYRQGRVSPNQTVFGIRGHTSSFHYGGLRLKLRALISRKGELSRTAVGRDCNKLWSLGSYNCTQKLFEETCKRWKPFEKQMVLQISHLLPAWILDELTEWIYA